MATDTIRMATDTILLTTDTILLAIDTIHLATDTIPSGKSNQIKIKFFMVNNKFLGLLIHT